MLLTNEQLSELENKGEYVIQICDGNSCHVRKSKKILKTVLRELGLDEEKITTDDGKFTVVSSPCMEHCAPGPIMKVNGEIYEHMTPEKASEILASLK